MNGATTLVSLAMLKVNLDVYRRDYFDYLVPFVLYVIGKFRPNPVADSVVQKHLREEFGLHFPLPVVGLVLRRLAKQKILRREHYVYYVVGQIPDSDIEKKRSDANRQTEVVLNRVGEFASSTYGLSWSPDEAIAAVTGYLARFSIECLRTYAHGTALPELARSKSKDLFIVNSFVRDVQARSPDIFDSFVVLVKGHMLANALICSDSEAAQRKFEGVTFYLDTPIILRLLELGGNYGHAVVAELLDLIRNLKGTIGVFEHTDEEVHRVLSWYESNLNNPQVTGRFIGEMRRVGIRVSDLTLMKGKLHDSYASHGIQRLRTPEYTVSLQIDEPILEKAMEDEIKYSNPRAVQYDINSIRSIYALRKGREPLRLEDSLAVLVTSNGALAKTAFDYGKEHESSREISTVITDFSLANIAWLKAPFGSPDLPRLEVIAMCYAAMEPGDGLWSKYLGEIDKLNRMGNILPKDYELLRYSPNARDELMNLTLGSEEEFSQQTIPEILERVKEDLVKEQTRSLKKEQEEHAQTIVDRIKLSRELDRVKKKVYWVSEKIGQIAGKSVLITACILLLLSSIVSARYAALLIERSFLATLLVTILVWGGVAWGLVNWIWGISVKDVAHEVEAWSKGKTYKLLSALFLDGELTQEGEPK